MCVLRCKCCPVHSPDFPLELQSNATALADRRGRKRRWSVPGGGRACCHSPPTTSQSGARSAEFISIVPPVKLFNPPHCPRCLVLVPLLPIQLLPATCCRVAELTTITSCRRFVRCVALPVALSLCFQKSCRVGGVCAGVPVCAGDRVAFHTLVCCTHTHTHTVCFSLSLKSSTLLLLSKMPRMNARLQKKDRLAQPAAFR